MCEPNQFQGGSNFNLGNSCATHGGGQFYSSRNVPPASAENPILVPPLPPRPDINTMNSQQQFGMTSQFPYGGMGSYGMGNYGGYGMGNYVGYGGYGNGYGMGGMGMGGMYGGYNRFGMNTPMYGDIETRFIQMAEERSRPAFDSIQSLVNAVGSIAMMLENTFFALTSSFRAILGVAENVGRLRSLFSQFWSTFAVITKLNWIVRKLLVMLGIRTESEFKAWAEAVAATQTGAPPGFDAPRASSWPVLLFFGVVAAAPYLVFKMLNSLTTSINEKLNDPTTWQNPLRAIASYNFQARSPQELSFSANQVLNIAPQSLQPHLWNSGWIMATADRKTAGLVPVNYIRIVVSKESEQNAPTEYSTELDLSNLSNESFESREPSTDKTNGRDS